jgi:hypothetical protein
MRTVLIISMFTASLAVAANDYVEERELNLDADGISAISIEAGAGSLEIKGVAGLDQIEVQALITLPGRNDEKAVQKIESDLVLYLEKQGSKAVLHGYFDEGMWNFGNSPTVGLIVRVPEHLDLDVDDGSGSVVIEKVRGDIEIEDGSGSLSMSDVGGDVEIDDGSGSISVSGVGGDISISDGSGSIKVRAVTGSVVVDDGSGSINVSDVGEDLIIEEDGSGSLDFSDIRGKIEKDG